MMVSRWRMQTEPDGRSRLTATWSPYWESAGPRGRRAQRGEEKRWGEENRWLLADVAA